MSTVTDVLRTTPLVKEMSDAEVELLAAATSARSVGARTYLMTEGEAAPGLVIIAHGEVEVLKKDGDGHDHRLALLEAGAILGENGLLGAGPAVASVRAASPVDYLLLEHEVFERIARDSCPVALKVATTIARVQNGRLHRMNEKLLELLHKEVPTGTLAELATFREKLFEDWDF